MVSDYSDGELKMPHLESTIETQRIMCFKKFIENYHSPWKLILSHYLENYGDKRIRINDKPQFCKKSFMAGISRTKDIFLTNGKLKPWNYFSE